MRASFLLNTPVFDIDLPTFLPGYRITTVFDVTRSPKKKRTKKTIALTVKGEDEWAANMLCKMIDCGTRVIVDDSWEEEFIPHPSDPSKGDTPPESVGTPKKRKRKPHVEERRSVTTHPRWKRHILKTWFLNHANAPKGPYPTEEEKEQLKAQTELTIKQIETFFSNGRRANRNLWSEQARSSYYRKKKRPIN